MTCLHKDRSFKYSPPETASYEYSALHTRVFGPNTAVFKPEYCCVLARILKSARPNTQVCKAEYSSPQARILKWSRRGLQIVFDGFLNFSQADFTCFLKEHSGLCDWERKGKMPDKNKKTQRATCLKYKFRDAWNLQNTPTEKPPFGRSRKAVCVGRYGRISRTS